jgi:ATP-binding cassette subfamily B protein
MAGIVDIGIVNGDTNYILQIGGLMLLVALLATTSLIISSYLSAKIASSYSKDLRSKVFKRVESFSLSEFDQVGTASLITRTTNDITQIERVTIMMLRMMLRAPMLLVGGIIMAVTRDARLSLLIVFIIPILLIMILIISKKAMPLFKSVQKKLDKINLVVREGLTGIRVIRAFNRKKHEDYRFNEANIELRNTSIRVNKIMASTMPLMMLIMNMSVIAILWFGSIRIDNGNMQVGDLMAFIQYIMQILFSLIMVSMIFVMLPRASASADRINEVLDIIPNIEDIEKDKDIDKNIDKKQKSNKGYLEFKNVSFNYADAEQPVIKNISFGAGPGEITAIIGGTGSGKSTLIKLIPRLYEITKGSILVNGIDIRNMTQKELRSKIGIIPQKAVLFSGTIADNIRYGKEDATEEEIKHAAEIAQATEFISNMEEGLDSVIAQGGSNLSGGQKQRLAIARALVRRPEIYIFDDSFSALDFNTDAKLRIALKREIKDSTFIIVAQRVTTIINADRIIVLDEGKIAGIGKHSELIKSCEVYKEIVSSQLSEEELA